jgi:anaerobic ribonucleoside-triphosphate reductase
MSRIDEINIEKAALRKALNEVRGPACECYQRVVGYYRDVRNWNVGKKAEFAQRLNFKFPDPERLLA